MPGLYFLLSIDHYFHYRICIQPSLLFSPLLPSFITLRRPLRCYAITGIVDFIPLHRHHSQTRWCLGAQDNAILLIAGLSCTIVVIDTFLRTLPPNINLSCAATSSLASGTVATRLGAYPCQLTKWHHLHRQPILIDGIIVAAPSSTGLANRRHCHNWRPLLECWELPVAVDFSIGSLLLLPSPDYCPPSKHHPPSA